MFIQYICEIVNFLGMKTYFAGWDDELVPKTTDSKKDAYRFEWDDVVAVVTEMMNEDVKQLKIIHVKEKL